MDANGSIRSRTGVQNSHDMRLGRAFGTGRVPVRELILHENEPARRYARQGQSARNAKRWPWFDCQVFGNQTTVTVVAAREHFALNVYNRVWHIV